MQDKCIIEDGPERKRLKVQLATFSNVPLLQLRYWYKDKRTGEVNPTKQGIALTKNNYMSLRSAMVDNHDEIMSHLNVDISNALNQGGLSDIRATQARKIESVSKIEWKLEYMRPVSKLYEVTYSGSTAEVIFNTAHSFVKCHVSDSNREVGTALANLIVSFDVSFLNTSGTDLTSPKVTLALLEDQLGRSLELLVRNIK